MRRTGTRGGLREPASSRASIDREDTRMSAQDLLAEVGDLQPKDVGSTGDAVAQTSLAVPRDRRAHGPWSDLALHTIGWRAFQDLCSQVCEVVLGRPVEIFREAQDGGQDAVFLIPSASDAPPIGTVQCKHTSEAGKALKVGDLTAEMAMSRWSKRATPTPTPS